MQTAEYITSPETGRPIRVGGSTYNRLSKTNNLDLIPKFIKEMPQKRQPSKPVSSAMIEEMKRLPLNEPDLQRSIARAKQPYLQRIAANYQVGEGRGSSTRGWSLDAPKTKAERRKLFDACGSKCFLLPDTLGFPICPKCGSDENPRCECKKDSRGITAATVRAKQFGYNDLLPALRELKNK